MQCPKCEANCAVKNGFVKGIQRYKCKKCGCQYTLPTSHGKPLQIKILALLLYLSGVSMNMTARIIGVTGQSVMRGVGQFGQACQEEQKGSIEEDEVEIDEMHHFIGKKNGFFGFGKYLVIPLESCLDGNVAIVARKPLMTCVKSAGSGELDESIQTNTKPMRK